MRTLLRCAAALAMLGVVSCSSVGEQDPSAKGAAGDSMLERDLQARAEDPCTFDIGPLPTEDGPISFGALSVDAAPLHHDYEHHAGWDFADPPMMSVVIYGPVCQDLRAGVPHRVTARFLLLLY